MGRLHSLWFFIRRHKYFVVIFGIILFVGVLDENSLLSQYNRKTHMDHLRHAIEVYKQQYEEADRSLQQLESGPQAVEKMARERYFMKRPDEDVFVIHDGSDKSDITEDSAKEVHTDTTNTSKTRVE